MGPLAIFHALLNSFLKDASAVSDGLLSKSNVLLTIICIVKAKGVIQKHFFLPVSRCLTQFSPFRCIIFYIGTAHFKSHTALMLTGGICYLPSSSFFGSVSVHRVSAIFLHHNNWELVKKESASDL